MLANKNHIPQHRILKGTGKTTILLEQRILLHTQCSVYVNTCATTDVPVTGILYILTRQGFVSFVFQHT